MATRAASFTHSVMQPGGFCRLAIWTNRHDATLLFGSLASCAAGRPLADLFVHEIRMNSTRRTALVLAIAVVATAATAVLLQQRPEGPGIEQRRGDDPAPRR